MHEQKPHHHQHKCKHYDTVWEHHDKCSQLAHTNREAYKLAHKCPKCNRPSLKKHHGGLNAMPTPPTPKPGERFEYTAVGTALNTVQHDKRQVKWEDNTCSHTTHADILEYQNNQRFQCTVRYTYTGTNPNDPFEMTGPTLLNPAKLAAHTHDTQTSKNLWDKITARHTAVDETPCPPNQRNDQMEMDATLRFIGDYMLVGAFITSAFFASLQHTHPEGYVNHHTLAEKIAVNIIMFTLLSTLWIAVYTPLLFITAVAKIRQGHTQ